MKKDREALAEYYFHEGTNYQCYKYLGCHFLKAENGKHHYVFRTWAPNAHHICLVGDYFGWEDGVPLKKVTERGIWEVYIEADASLENTKYKFKIYRDFRYVYKGDPYAFYSEGGKNGASYVYCGGDFNFDDKEWLSNRSTVVRTKEGSYLAAPINIYELHFSSFIRHSDGSYYSYREMAEVLVPYIKYMGYTHIELMPIAEHPFDGSWGYQICAFYAPSSRFGTPDDFKYFISAMHRAGIGVILDWVGAHFPKDEWGLYEFDGKPLYEYQGYDRMESRSWGTRFFDLGREEVQCFLISNAIYWLSEFHVDGLRVDAVASMLYLDYDRQEGEWIPNIYGGKENLEAKAFLQKLNTAVFEAFSDALMIAEESTAWYGVTYPVSVGGLGFNLKWNMGWANDFFDYLSKDAIYRKYHHTALNFPIMYAFSENFILPISHDEVVHGKGSLISKIFGDYDDKFRQFRTAMLFMMTFPGKKLSFMGTEFAQFSEWNYNVGLEWFLLDFEKHNSAREFVSALNRFYLNSKELWEIDFNSDGFEWIYPNEFERNFLAYKRKALDGSELICLVSFSGAEYKNMKIRATDAEAYEILFDTIGIEENNIPIYTKYDEYGCFFEIDMPRMSAMVLKRI